MTRPSTWLRTHPEARLILIAAAVALVFTSVVVVSITHERASGARSVARPPATSTVSPPVGPPSATPNQEAGPTYAPTPDDTAKAFAVAYLSWEWDRSMPAMQANVQPYVTDDLYGRLATEPGPQWTNPGGVDVHEVDTPRVVSATQLDSDAIVARVLVAVLVTQRTDGGATEHPVALVVRIKRESGGWKVDEVDR